MNTLTNFPGYPNGTLKRVMEPEGDGSSGILAIGESLGAHEEADQLPFRPQADAGGVLERALYRSGVPRSSLTLTNLVWYRPPNNFLDGAHYEREAIQACKRFNDDLVHTRSPRVILALGGLAMREMSGLSGERAGIQMTRGFVVDGFQYDIPVVGTYHPSFLRRGSKDREAGGAKGKTESAGGGTQGMALLGALIRDILFAKEVASNGRKKFEYDDYRLGATLDDWQCALERLRANRLLPISYDFETRDTLLAADESEMEIVRRDVTQVQISWRSGQALVSPWTPDLIPILRAILELSNPKLDWNGRKFDRPILRELGIRTNVGEWHDLMDCWHHAQPDLPRGLQYATSFVCPEAGPWKHLSGSDPLWYGALDVDMPQRIYECLRASLSGTREVHSGVSLWDGYINQVVRVAPVLDRMTERGIPVDESKRVQLDAEFSAEITRLESECQTLHPLELRNLHPKNGFVRPPEEIRIECLICSGRGKVPNVPTDVNLFGEPIKRRTPKFVICEDCHGAGWVQVVPVPPDFCQREFTIDGTPVTRWSRIEPFLPGSPQQVLKYIQWREDSDLSGKWQVPWNKKESRATTAEMELRRLAKKTGDRLLTKILEFREVQKARSTYVLGWKPGPDGRVHPNFGFRPATPQLSSDSPNAQNFPQHAEISHKMKQMIRATPPAKWVKFDWKSFHVITGGFEAQDLEYIRIARVDMHGFLTLVGLIRAELPEDAFAWSDSELRDRLKWWKKETRTYPEYARSGFAGGMTFSQIRDYIAKRVVFGWEFGQGLYSLWSLNQEVFAGVKEAEKCQETLRNLFPRVDKWQFEVRLRADEQKCLLTRFGHVRRFWDVFHRRPVSDTYVPRGNERVWVHKNGTRWLLKPGDDHEAAVAYLPAADALGMKRRALAWLGSTGLDEKYGLTVEVHDDLRFHTPYVDSLIADVKPFLESKVPELTDPLVAPGGLWCETEASVGEDWDSWEKI